MKYLSILKIPMDKLGFFNRLNLSLSILFKKYGKWQALLAKTEYKDLPINPKPTFKVLDRVEFHKGGTGTVWRILRDQNTLEVIGCDVIWDDYKLRGNPYNITDPIQGQNISITLPAIDKGRKFNPIIRRKSEWSMKKSKGKKRG